MMGDKTHLGDENVMGDKTGGGGGGGEGGRQNVLGPYGDKI